MTTSSNISTELLSKFRTIADKDGASYLLEKSISRNEIPQEFSPTTSTSTSIFSYRIDKVSRHKIQLFMAKHKCKQADAVEWFMRKELESRELEPKEKDQKKLELREEIKPEPKEPKEKTKKS